jgi:hypothetical protein
MGIGNWFKAQVFGSSIKQTLGRIEGRNLGPISVDLKVHLLEGTTVVDPRLIGIELTAKSVLSYKMMGITLSKAEVQQLISLLNSAIQ